MSTRWYTPAYMNQHGEIMQCGTESRDYQATEWEAHMIGQDVKDHEVFVAFKDEPDWQRCGEAS